MPPLTLLDTQIAIYLTALTLIALCWMTALALWTGKPSEKDKEIQRLRLEVRRAELEERRATRDKLTKEKRPA